MSAARNVLAVLLTVIVTTTIAGEAVPTRRTTDVQLAFEQTILPILKTHCLRCHGAEKHKADVDFSRITTGAAALGSHKTELKDGLVRLLAREMPPEKEPSLTDEEHRQVSAWMSSLKRLSPLEPGPASLRRLARNEYANTLRDLFGVDVAVAADLAVDGVGPGFSNSISPLQMEKYLLIADGVLDQIIRPGQLQVVWKAGQWDLVTGGKIQVGKADGGERDLRGADQFTTTITLPVDGTYTVQVRASSERLGKEPARLFLRVDNQVVGEAKITATAKTPALAKIRTKLSAGKTSLTLFIANPVVAAEESAKPGVAKTPTGPTGKQDAAAQPPAMRAITIDTIELLGPPAATPTDVQRRLFTAMPSKDLPKREAARHIAESFARKAYRRPASAKEVENLLKVFDLADQQDEVFTESVKLMLKSVLVSPQFLYLAAETKTSTGSKVIAVGDHQLAAKLSYLLWATMPDDELSALADQGTLHEPNVLEQQVRRLIADPRSRAFFDGFGAQWLGLELIQTMDIDEAKFPEFTKELRSAMYNEASLFFLAVLRENRSLIDLLDADFTFMNASLAKIYGQEGAVKGAQMQRVTLTDANRGGLLTMPGILAVHSLPNRTSPVKRGRWVLEQILGRYAPPPPADVAPLEQQAESTAGTLSTRQRYERHRLDPACAGCHRSLDPLGFALENFDVIGRWRVKDDSGQPVDATGELPGKISFRTPRDFKQAIAKHQDEFCRTVVLKILAHALCRAPNESDEVIAEDIAVAVAKDGYRLQSVLVQIVLSYPFRHSR